MGHQIAFAPLTERRQVHIGARRLDDLSPADIDRGVVDAHPVGLTGTPEDEVARLQVGQRHGRPGGQVLIVRHSCEPDTGSVLP